MSVIDEAIVREYFEAHGFLVRQHRKYAVSGREKRTDEEIDLLVHNPRAGRDPRPTPPFFRKSDDLPFLSCALIEIKGWHSERFGPSILNKPDFLRFVEKAAEREARLIFGTDKPLQKLLVLPELAADPTLRERCIEILKRHGIDGVFFFKEILSELMQRIEKNKNYQKSDVLQMLRILKAYDLLKDPQLELFGKKPRKRKR
jgi:hypothetical protein